MTVIAGMGEVIERNILGVGLLRFEDCAAGEWLTAKGQPAKKARRRYLLGGDELDSVSSITNTLSKDSLVRWAEKHGCLGGVLAERAGALTGLDPDDWVKACQTMGVGASAAREEGIGRGLAVHAGMDTLARTGEPPNAADYPERWRPWLRGSARVWLALNPEPIESEQIVCNVAYGYAGRPDLFALCDRRRTLIDYKSSTNGRIFDQAHYSTRGYAECYAPCGIEPPERIVIAGIAEDGSFEIVECEVNAEDWYDVLRVYRSRKRVMAGMAAQRKARKAAA